MSYGYQPQLESNMGPSMEAQGGILVTKRSILSNPGTKIANTLYYSALNTQVNVSEITWTQGRYSQNLSAPQFGATSTVIIPNGSFVQTMILHLELPAIPANVCLNRGWGFEAINNINFLMGSSNVPQITISGASIYQIIMAQCETVGKRNEMLALAGQEILTAQANYATADFIIPLPFSSAAGPDCQLPFDTNLLQNPIMVQISFNPVRSFAQGIGVDSWVNAFASASVQLKLGDMLNKDQGLRRPMQADPSLIYGYPFNHFQSFSTGFTGVVGNPNSTGFPQAATINLLGFINADLLGIIVGVVKASDVSNSVSNPVNPFNYAEVTNVQCLFNGLVMHATPKQQHKLTGMNSCLDATYVQQSFINAPITPGTAPFTSYPYNNYQVYIDFAGKRSMNFFMEYENVWRIPNNTITLSLNTPDTSSYILQCTYVYNGMCNVRAGETEVFFS